MEELYKDIQRVINGQPLLNEAAMPSIPSSSQSDTAIVGSGKAVAKLNFTIAVTTNLNSDTYVLETPGDISKTAVILAEFFADEYFEANMDQEYFKKLKLTKEEIESKNIDARFAQLIEVMAEKEIASILAKRTGIKFNKLPNLNRQVSFLWKEFQDRIEGVYKES